MCAHFVIDDVVGGQALRIRSETFERIHQLSFLNAAKRGGVESQSLPFFRAVAEGLPTGIDSLVITSDLQGVVSSWRHGGENVLLGIQVAEELFDLSDSGVIPNPDKTAVLLAGDLYAAPGGDKRGASGDVREVWTAFAAMNQWVAGVAGNHDSFGSSREEARLHAIHNVDILDGDLVERGTVRFGGVGYIVGNPEKPGRREEGEFFAALDLVLGEKPDVLLLHEGPSGTRAQRGNPYVREEIEKAPVPLVVCGHVHWEEPLAQLGPTQILNVDSRVVVLVR